MGNGERTNFGMICGLGKSLSSLSLVGCLELVSKKNPMRVSVESGVHLGESGN